MTKQMTKTTKTMLKTLKTLVIAGLLLVALLLGACGGDFTTRDPSLNEDQVVATTAPAECRAAVKSMVDTAGLKGVLSVDKHDANPGTPNTLEFEVVTGMFEGVCDGEMELYVNGNPAKMLRSNGETTTFLASVDSGEPEVLLTAYCGQCKQGAWGATIK